MSSFLDAVLEEVLAQVQDSPAAQTIVGDATDNQLFGLTGNDFISGLGGNDLIDGGTGNDQLAGGDGIDTLTGGIKNDQFIFDGNVFANGTPALAGQTGIAVLNRPDIIPDYTIGEDQFVFNGQDLGIENFVFQEGTSSQIGDGNAIVLLDPFPAAGAAARAIANNPNITADEGVFVYFNSTLGISRLVYSRDLSDGGDISVLANLTSQQGAAGLANIGNFSGADFALI